MLKNLAFNALWLQIAHNVLTALYVLSVWKTITITNRQVGLKMFLDIKECHPCSIYSNCVTCDDGPICTACALNYVFDRTSSSILWSILAA